jgi:prepilin signal peptidase PulO-like enzyme (type II secretory pathway)
MFDLPQVSTTILVVTASVLGLLFGSAINAIVWRLYVGRSWVHGRSMCPECKHVLAAKDLVPVVSWLALRGKCRYCQARIHWQYPAVEILTACLFGLSAYVLGTGALGGWLRLGFWLVILVMLIVVAVYDTRWMILPDKVVLPMIGVALVYTILGAFVAHSLKVVLGPLEAAALVGGAFYAIVVLSKGRAMGGGDIKLVFAMGLILGLQSMTVALLFAFNLAAIVGVVLIATGIRGRRDHIPFGPFLVTGTVLAFLFAHPLIQWYLNINGV